jgi:hypothetical protein
MPRNVRNFWIELDVDGKKQRVATGPVRSDGGFRIRVLIRDQGGISSTTLTIQGIAHDDGSLTVTAGRESENDTWPRQVLLRGKR